MAGVLVIEVYDPGERADELLAAIAAKLRAERLEPDPTGRISVMVEDWDIAYEAAQDALQETGDDGQLIVRPLRPPQ